MTPTQDTARYAELMRQWVELIERGLVDSPELQTLWAEVEAIKNRNGGMPPKE